MRHRWHGVYWIFFVMILFISLRADAFSEGFKKYMALSQEKIMLKGEKLTSLEVSAVWGQFDGEVISLLSQGESEEAALNQEGKTTELSVMDHEDLIELGSVGADFHRLGSGDKTTWLVGFNNLMGKNLPVTTFHIFKKVDGRYAKVASLEEAKGPWVDHPWEKKLALSLLQLQIIDLTGGTVRFASFHKARGSDNRSEIAWQFEKTLRPTHWIPEVDWHLVNGSRVQGRGEVLPIK